MEEAIRSIPIGSTNVFATSMLCADHCEFIGQSMALRNWSRWQKIYDGQAKLWSSLLNGFPDATS